MTAFSLALAKHQRLQERIAHSKEFLAEVQHAIEGLTSGRSPHVCMFAVGSLGRFETGRRSDLDVFLLAHRDDREADERSISRLAEIQTFANLIRLNENLGLPAFSGDGRFLKVHELDDLIKATGDSSRDDSENLFTARLLLLLESKPLSNLPLYEMALNRVLENYFRDGKGRRAFQPLFLLNDVLRYWRTLCLNYERDRTLKKPWWKKNLNLKFARKLTVFSTVLAIVAEQVRTTEEFTAFSRSVPLERLAKVLDQMADDDLLLPFKALLDDYENFLAAKSYSELEEKDQETLEMFRSKAEIFGDFLIKALQSKNLKPSLVRYVLI